MWFQPHNTSLPVGSHPHAQALDLTSFEQMKKLSDIKKRNLRIFKIQIEERRNPTHLDVDRVMWKKMTQPDILICEGGAQHQLTGLDIQQLISALT